MVVRLAVVLLVVVGIVMLVRWLEPRMAFYPLRGVQETPGDLGQRFEDLSIPTQDGETLHAWWLAHENPRAQVLFFHGNGGNLSLWLDVIADLHRRGFSVLAVDYRGYGASTGRPSERGLYKDADGSIRAFHQRVRSGRPVIYWGRSLGCPVAAYSASIARPDALVLESPMPDVRTILRSNPVLWVLSFVSSYRFGTSQWLRSYDGPLLVVHGDADSIIPYSAGRTVFDRAPGAQKRFVTIPGADHNDLHLVNPQLYWKEIDAFVATLVGRGFQTPPRGAHL
jgi:uncharacterized protein